MNNSTSPLSRTNSQIVVSSTIASLVSATLTNPIEVAKLNRQYYVTACPQFPHQNYRKMIQCGCGKFSFKNSFNGLKVALPQSVLSSIGYMQLYEWQRQYYMQKIDNPTACTLTAALVSRFIMTTLMNPIESLRVRMGNVIKDQKLKAVSGLKVTLVRDLIFSALFWTTLQTLRSLLFVGDYRKSVLENQQSQARIFWLNFTAGVVSGVLISAITTPLDAIKTRIQSDSKPMPIIRSIVDIYRKEGFNGLFSGVQYRVPKVTLHTTLYVIIYESMMRNMQLKH